jgi:hypothetical protein
MGLQTQLLSQKRFDQHLDPPSFCGQTPLPSKNWMNRGFMPPTSLASRCMDDTSTSITLLGEEPTFAALCITCFKAGAQYIDGLVRRFDSYKDLALSSHSGWEGSSSERRK